MKHGRTTETLHGWAGASAFRKQYSDVVSSLTERMPHLSRRGPVLDHVDMGKDLELNRQSYLERLPMLKRGPKFMTIELFFDKNKIIELMTGVELPLPRILYQSTYNSLSPDAEIITTYTDPSDGRAVIEAVEQCEFRGQRFWIECPAGPTGSGDLQAEVKEVTSQKGGCPSKKWPSSGRRLLVRFATAAFHSFTFIEHALEENGFTVR
jgi:hypothetical protein